MELAKLENEWKRLQKEWNLQEWKFGYHNRKRSFGTCFWGSKRILISRWHVTNDPEKHVIDTLLHEVAHALAGRDAGHGPVWKEWARRLGATPERCMPHEGMQECTRIPGRYQATCPGCKLVFHKYRKGKLDGWNCRKCGKENGKLVFVEVEQAPKRKLF